MEGAHPDMIRLSAEAERTIEKMDRQYRLIIVLAVLIPGAGIVAMLLALGRAL